MLLLLARLARSAQYIFMKDVTGGRRRRRRASCGRREAANVTHAYFHVACNVTDSRLEVEAPCSVRHCREHFYLIAYLAREFTRTLLTQTERWHIQVSEVVKMSCLLAKAIGSCMLPHLSQVFGTPYLCTPWEYHSYSGWEIFFAHGEERERQASVE